MSNQSLTSITQLLESKINDKPAFGHSAKFAIEGLGVIVLDGTGDKNTVTSEDKETEVTFKMSLETLLKMQNKEISGMEAFFQGLMVIEGDQSVAMELGQMMDL